MRFLLYLLGAVVLVSLAASIASALGVAPAVVNLMAGVLLAASAVVTAASRRRAAR